MTIKVDPQKTMQFRLIAVLLSALSGLVTLSILVYSAGSVTAHSGDLYGPACGKAVIDGDVDSTEWSPSATMTVTMIPTGATTPLTAMVRIMNSANYLHLGITINDDEFTKSGQFLSAGDGFRIDFDNNHGGSLFEIGDDVLTLSAGSPQFEDSYIDGNPVPESSEEDINSGGTSDGSGAASRVSNLNHYEARHPLCSGDGLDYCLQAGDVVGFRLEYLDAEGDGSFGGSYRYPGTTATDIADIEVGSCNVPDLNTYLPAIRRNS